jgi:hypothetical protein
MMDRVQEPSDSECYTPPSEPFRFSVIPNDVTVIECLRNVAGGVYIPHVTG